MKVQNGTPYRVDELYESLRVGHLEIGDAHDLAGSTIFHR